MVPGAVLTLAFCERTSGAEIVFESDRGGSQQIYVMSANGGNALLIGRADQFCDVTRFGKAQRIEGLGDFTANSFSKMSEGWITHGLGSKVH